MRRAEKHEKKIIITVFGDVHDVIANYGDDVCRR